MRSFENRNDTFVSDEPFYAHFLKQTGVDHPMRDEVIKSGNPNWATVSDYLTNTIPDGKSVWYQKHMAQHNLPGVDLGWAEKVFNCFLIRDPKEVILSYTKKYAISSVYQLGLPQQFDLFTQLREKGEVAPIILDSTDILTNPESMLKKLCRTLGIPFTNKMLKWPKGRRKSDGVWGKHWYNAVEQSTSFQAYQKKCEKIPIEYTAIYEESIEFYLQLYNQRIQ
tara:strand:+ start:78 stop:749 length:672 start_codon:yes stop_codon:yes gene_type:complete